MEDPPIRTWGNDDNNQTKKPLGLCNDHNWSVLQHKTRVRACGPFGTGELWRWPYAHSGAYPCIMPYYQFREYDTRRHTENKWACESIIQARLFKNITAGAHTVNWQQTNTHTHNDMHLSVCIFRKQMFLGFSNKCWVQNAAPMFSWLPHDPARTCTKHTGTPWYMPAHMPNTHAMRACICFFGLIGQINTSACMCVSN